jgi:ferredoxin, 2Fe-2S
MPDVFFVQADGRELGFEAPEGVSLMQAATGHGVEGVVAECGGSLRCATCHVYLDEAWTNRVPSAKADELYMLDFVAAERRAGSRLSCQVALTAELQGLVVHVPERQY